MELSSDKLSYEIAVKMSDLPKPQKLEKKLIDELKNHLAEKKQSQINLDDDTGSVCFGGEVKVVERIKTSEMVGVEDSKVSTKVKSVIKKVKSKVYDFKHYNNESYTFHTVPEIETNNELSPTIDKFTFIRNLSRKQRNEELQTKIYNCQIAKFSGKQRRNIKFESQPLIELNERCVMRIEMNTTKHNAGNYMTIGFKKSPYFLPTNTAANMCFFYQRILIIKDKSQDGGKQKHIIFEDEPPFGERMAELWYEEYYYQPKFVSNTLLNREHYIGIEDNIQISCILRPLKPLYYVYNSDNGILNWTVDNVSSLLEEEQRGVRSCLYSPNFYTSPNGYRVRCRLYLNGSSIATGNFMSIFLDFLTGEWDENLPELSHFPHSTIFTLLDYDHKKDVIKCENNFDGFASDIIYDFIHHSHVFYGDYRYSYLKNDCLHLTVTVQPQNQIK